MRLLARGCASASSTKRAYEELEREGLIVTQTGRGSFVAQVSGARLRPRRGGASGAGGTRGEQGGLTAEEFMEDRTNGFEEGINEKRTRNQRADQEIQKDLRWTASI